VIESGLEGLVFHQHRHAFGQGIVPLAEGTVHAVFALRDVVLAGVVGAIREPEAEQIGTDGFGNVDGVEHVAVGVLGGVLVGAADGAELVDLVLEEGGVD
jgi:hypothetical protein